MKGLTIKEIAPYLPYELKSYNEEYKEIFQVCSFRQDSEEWLIHDNIDGSVIEYSRDILKPILRPLSDLDNYLRNEFEKLDKGYVYDKIEVDLFCEENGVSELIEHTEIKSLPYECVEYMFEHHYDVFGLIEKGLAIDINTLNK